MDDRSFDLAVGAYQDGLRNLDAESFRGSQIDDQLELRRLLGGEIARFRTLEKLVNGIA